MTQSYVGEIRMFSGWYAPRDWMLCDGQLLKIADYDALFNLIGTTYGGDGKETFALPDLRDRIPIHIGPAVALGQSGGAESVPLNSDQVPTHNHILQGSSSSAQSLSPAMAILAAASSQSVSGLQPYGLRPASIPLSSSSISPAGYGMPHDNLQPFLCVNFIISLYGTFPPQS